MPCVESTKQASRTNHAARPERHSRPDRHPRYKKYECRDYSLTSESRYCELAPSEPNAYLVRMPAKVWSIFRLPHHGFTSINDEVVTQIIFYALANDWKRQTGHFSVFQQKAEHPLYQVIIALGDRVIPTLILELQNSPRNWFWALRQITKCNPVRKGASIEQAVEDWSSWWRDRLNQHAGVD